MEDLEPRIVHPGRIEQPEQAGPQRVGEQPAVGIGPDVELEGPDAGVELIHERTVLIQELRRIEPGGSEVGEERRADAQGDEQRVVGEAVVAVVRSDHLDLVDPDGVVTGRHRRLVGRWGRRCGTGGAEHHHRRQHRHQYRLDHSRTLHPDLPSVAVTDAASSRTVMQNECPRARSASQIGAGWRYSEGGWERGEPEPDPTM